MSWLERLMQRERLDAEAERELRFHREEAGTGGEAGMDAALEACREGIGRAHV